MVDKSPAALNIKKISHLVTFQITYLITFLMIHPLKFKVISSKTVVDSVVIQKSSQFESKCKEMK